MAHAHTHDIAVIGGGAGGFAAALGAARMDARVILVERADRLGGNAVIGGVHHWESVAGATGVPLDLYRRIRADHGSAAIGVTSLARHLCFGDPFPGGELRIDPARRYRDTLQRHGTSGLRADARRCRQQWHGIAFEPEAMSLSMRTMLEDTGRCDLRLNTPFDAVTVRDRRIESVTLGDGSTIRAGVYIDATADVHLAHAAGCPTRSGQEPRALWDEPSAPDRATDRVNGVSLIYRVSPRDGPSQAIDPLPDGVPGGCWWAAQFPVAAFVHYPRGDINVNTLPTMDGLEAMTLWRTRGPDAVLAECRRRVRAHWHDLQTRYDEFRRYRMSWIAPVPGVRESRRIVARRTLTEHDLLAGVNAQTDPDLIALSDHARDTHGSHPAGHGELPGPYGVPMRCLMPVDRTNLLVACRGAGFSSVAASSCRLTRTMMQLGQAAGLAAVMALADGRDPVDWVDAHPDRLRRELASRHVQLHPQSSPQLIAHLGDD